MADQFDVIEAGERGHRRWIGLAVLFALLLILVVSLLASRDPEPQPTSMTQAPDPIRSLTRLRNAPNLLNAPAARKGDDEVMHVVFPDGTSAEVRYPADLDLDELGSRPYQGGWIGDSFREFMAPYGGEVEVTRGGEPIRNYAPNVTLWPRQPGSGFYGQVLLFAFGPWRLAMYEQEVGLTFEQRMALARDLKGRVTKEGYLVLSGRGSVRLAKPGDTVRGEPVGPQLWFGGGAGQMVALVPTPDCAKHRKMPDVIVGRGRPADMVCRGDVLVAVTGPGRFQAEAIEGIRVAMK